MGRPLQPLPPLPSQNHQRQTLSHPSLALEEPTWARSRPRTSSSTLLGSKPLNTPVKAESKKCHLFKLTTLSHSKSIITFSPIVTINLVVEICSITNTNVWPSNF